LGVPQAAKMVELKVVKTVASMAVSKAVLKVAT
jgi:hypothetical protein